MANEIITTLHPDQNPNIDLYPNIKKENVPNNAIDYNRLDEDVKSLLNSINELHPSGVDTSTNILAFTTNKGIWVGSDTGNWYYWDGTQYVSGGVYQSTEIADGSIVTQDLVDGCVTPQKTFDDVANRIITYNVQTINVDDAIMDKAWSNNGTYGNATNYVVYPKFNLRKGTYYCYRLSPVLSYVQNANTGEITSLSNYVTDSNSQFSTHTIVVPFDFILMITTTHVPNYYGSTYFTNDQNNLNNNYYGYYNYKINGKEIDNTSNIYYVGSTREYTKLIDGIAEAVLHPNSIVYVDDGVYDLLDEYGEDVLDATSTIFGIELKNNVKVIFSGNSKVVFNYTGSNTYIHRVFSPFNAGVGGFTIENLNLECSNCRYCVHDERGGSTDNYINKYINCNMKIDNSNNPDWSNTNTIGGGLGYSGVIIVDGGKYYGQITYHSDTSGISTLSKSSITIKNTYCYNDIETYNIMITSPSTSTLTTKSDVFITNNSTIKPIIKVDSGNCYNYYNWHNELRS